MDPKVDEDLDPKFLPSETGVVLDPKFLPSETVVFLDPKVDGNFGSKFLPSEIGVLLDPKVDENLDPNFLPSETAVFWDPSLIPKILGSKKKNNKMTCNPNGEYSTKTCQFMRRSQIRDETETKNRRTLPPLE